MYMTTLGWMIMKDYPSKVLQVKSAPSKFLFHKIYRVNANAHGNLLQNNIYYRTIHIQIIEKNTPMQINRNMKKYSSFISRWMLRKMNFKNIYV